MSTVDVQNEITNMQSSTAQYKAATETKTTGTSTLSSDAFLTLMLQQLQYQDPTDPVSNQDMIAQQAQLSQLTSTQNLEKNTASNNAIMQTLSLVGAQVTLANPDDSTKTITGVVTSASINGSNSSITVNGTDYALSSVKSVTVPTATN